MKIANLQSRVKVPATSANLGPGFDCMGLALKIHDLLEASAVTGATEVSVVGEGAGSVPQGEDHLVVRAMRHLFDFVDAPQTGIRLRCVNRIPHGRGLGSSAAAVVAGLLLAKGLVSEPELLTNEVLLRLATEFEGHPDNAAPAIYGGFTAAWMDAEHLPHSVNLAAVADLPVTVCVPQATLATAKARSVLPSHVPHSDAAFNAGRAALLVHALTQDPARLFEATQDRLHQDYRADSMRPTADLVTHLRERGFAATVSGAGPTIVVLGADLGQVTPVVREAAARESDWIMRSPGIDSMGARLIDTEGDLA
ncbi:homoserine kinase [Micrococcales bacterium 31B]|nr:homoserine kinase [Micrococcales bacterium 31B]